MKYVKICLAIVCTSFSIYSFGQNQSIIAGVVSVDDIYVDIPDESFNIYTPMHQTITGGIQIDLDGDGIYDIGFSGYGTASLGGSEAYCHVSGKIVSRIDNYPNIYVADTLKYGEIIDSNLIYNHHPFLWRNSSQGPAFNLWVNKGDRYIGLIAPDTTSYCWIRINVTGSWSQMNLTVKDYACNRSILTTLDIVDSKSFSIYPNPTTSQLNIEISEPIINKQIIDLSGRVVYSENDDKTTIQIAHLPTGIYFLKLNTEKAVYQQKFVKN